MSKANEVQLSQLLVEDNVRKTMDTKGLDDLAASIAANGIISPLLVEPNGTGDTFVVIAGHRRRAAIEIGQKDGIIPADFAIPVQVSTEGNRVVLQLVENLQREDISLIDEARGFAQLKEQGLTQKDIAAQVGRSEGHVSKRLSLLTLPEDVVKLVEDGKVPVEVAVELPKLNEETARDMASRDGVTLRAVKAAIDTEKRRKAKAKAKAELEENYTVFKSYDEINDACPKGKIVHRGEPVSKVSDLPKRLAGVQVLDYLTDLEMVPITFKAPSKEAVSAEEEREKAYAAEDRRRERQRKAFLKGLDEFVNTPPTAAQLVEMIARLVNHDSESSFVTEKRNEANQAGVDPDTFFLTAELSGQDARSVVATHVVGLLRNRANQIWSAVDVDYIEALIQVGADIGVHLEPHTEDNVLGTLARRWEVIAADQELAEEQAIAEAEAEAEEPPSSDEESEATEVAEG